MQNMLYIISCECPSCHYKPSRKCPVCAAGKRHTIADDHDYLATYLADRGWAVMQSGGRHPYILAARNHSALAQTAWLSASEGTTSYEEDGAFVIPTSCHSCWKAKRNQHIAIYPPYIHISQADFVRQILHHKED